MPSILAACLLASLLVCACVRGDAPDSDSGSGTAGGGPSFPPVIAFDTGRLDARGLQGPPDGLRSLMYEFCIPDDRAARSEVRAIDASVRFQPGAPGRIGCADGQVLAVGDTGQPGWREVLERLAGLPYVTRIEESFAE
jgi:hypothetical protein